MGKFHYDRINQANDSRTFLGPGAYKPLHSSSKGTKVESGKSQFPIPWNREIGIKIYNVLSKLRYPYRREKLIEIDYSIRFEFKKFLISLDAYVEAKGLMKPNDIFIKLVSEGLNMKRSLNI